MQSQKFELISFANADELASRAASAWLDEIESANRAAKPHCVALSGGRIALKFFTSIVEQSKSRKISLGLVHFFWADERCVPPDDTESNFRAAHELLFAPLKISDAQIHRIRGELSPDKAAELATAEIRRVISNSNPLTPTLSPFGRGEGEDLQPVLDLIFLGLGEDGHVASLFPGKTDGTNPKDIFCAVENSPKPPPNRVSLSYATIVAAKKVWVLASGTGKETALRESISANSRTPLAQVIQSRPEIRIFHDLTLA